MKATGGTRRVRPEAAVPVGVAPAEQRALHRRPTPAADVPLDRLSRRIERVCDDLLDFLVLAFAAWTVIYHVCLVLDVGSVWALAAEAAALVPCGWLAVRRSETEPETPRHHDVPARPHPRVNVVRVVYVPAVVGAAGLFAFTALPWGAVWLLWVLTAGSALILTSLRPVGPVVNEQSDEAIGNAVPDGTRLVWPATVVALTWALGLGALSLFLVRSDADDTQYVHLSSWVAAHGVFPVRDTLFSDQVLPAVIFPPLSSFEALIGSVARVTDLAAPALAYLLVPPLASALAVLATWRLLRTWGVRMVGLALSAAMVFLLMDAQAHQTLGNLFVGRMWQGKIVFLAVLIPVLFALLIEYVERPTRRQLVLLAAAGAAGVGLTSSAVFVVPVVAAGCLAPLVIRSTRQVVSGFAATAAYPLAAVGATVVVGTRNAASYDDVDVLPGTLVHLVLGDDFLALVGMTAILVGPVLIGRALAARMTAGTNLLVACLFAPSLSLFLFHLIGLGRVQWRWMWAVPTAALVGVVATALGARIRAPALRAVPAALLCAALVAWGTPVWSSGATTVAAKPAWKRAPESLAAARRILAHARPGDTILAPTSVSQTILVISGTVTTVAARPFYARALIGVRGGHGRERLLLAWFAEQGLGRIERGPGWIRYLPSRTVEASHVRRALQIVRVDLACVDENDTRARRVLLATGYSPVVTTRELNCLRASRAGSVDDRSDR